jgi:hypothetical protein
MHPGTRRAAFHAVQLVASRRRPREIDDVNYNFFNRVNFGAYLTALLRDLPAIVDGLEKFPGAKANLGIDWVCKRFDLSKFDEEQAADPTSVL